MSDGSGSTVTDAQEASFDRRLFIGSIWSARLWPPGFQLVMDAPPRHGRYLVVSGTLRIDIEDHGVHDFSTGSFVEIIGPVRHTVSCTSSSDCVFYAIPSWMDALAARPRERRPEDPGSIGCPERQLCQSQSSARAKASPSVGPSGPVSSHRPTWAT